MTLKPLLTTLASTFLGGVVGYLSTGLSGVPTTAHALQGVAMSAALAGVVAVYHLYQPVPPAPAAKS